MRSMKSWAVVAVAALAFSSALTGLDWLVEGELGAPAEMAVDFLERLLLVGAMFGSAGIVLKLRGIEDETEALRRDVGVAAAEGAAWRMRSRRFTDGLSRAIEAQFATWTLTPAETDIAGLMLKGAALKEIARARSTSEATIRQQAQGIYRKSGLANRAELSAYFLEDLFSIGEASMGPAAANGGARPI